MRRRITTEEWFFKARKVHGDRYDYSQSKYEKSNSKIDIICREHGIFRQMASNHLAGQNCPKCRIYRKSFSNSEFIEKAIKVHGEIYDYSQVEYKYNHINVKIVCKKHGFFYQRPKNHLLGCGCPICGNEKRKESMKEYSRLYRRI